MDSMDDQGYFSWQYDYFHSLTPSGKLAFIYVLDHLLAGRDYISTVKMAKDTGLNEPLCDRFVRQFVVDRELPRMTIVEELVG